MRKFWYGFVGLLLAFAAQGQQPFQVKGITIDTAGQPLAGVNIKILHGTDSVFAITDKTGAFSFSQINTNKFTLTATYVGLEAFVKSFEHSGASPLFQTGPLLLAPATDALDSVVIQSVRPVIVKEDTIQYNASSYKVRDGAPVEDIIKKLPGVTVDKDGNVEAQGKKVARVRVNGKDFFGGDVQTATQNIPAELIQNIQVIDDYGDQANLTGVKTGEPEKIININTQPNRNRGTFGNATAAVGTEGRVAANLFANNFRDERQFSVLASVNNTNANLFNFNGGGRGGGARGANFGSEGRAGAGGAGITLTKSAGVNVRDKWGTKLSVYGSYSFSTRTTSVNSLTFSQDINPLNIRNTQRQSSSENSSANHRFTWNMEYAMDSFNFLKFSPYVSYNSGRNESTSFSEISRKGFFTQNNSRSASSNESPNAGGNVLYNHRFRKRGRNFSTNLTFDYSDNGSDRMSYNDYRNLDSTTAGLLTRDTSQIQTIGTQSRNTRTNVYTAYMEPLNASGSTTLEVNYSWNKSATESVRDVTDFLNATDKSGLYNERQSNHFRYTFITNRAGLSLRGRTEKYNYSVGFQAQPSSLSGRTVGKNINTSYTNVNWIPSLRFVYNFARSNSLTVTADGAAREPSFFQLQPVADSSNLNNIVIGNPNLVNEFTNTLSVRYNKFDREKGSTLFINFSYDRTNDKIVSSRFNDTVGTGRRTTYTNTDGFYGYNANASYTKPFSNRKFTAGVSLFGNYDNNISFTDGFKNTGSNWTLRPGANFRIDLDDKVDLTLRADYTAYQTLTRYASRTTNIKAQTLNLGVNGKNYFGDLTVGYDFSRLVNYGFSGSVSTNPSILNVYTEYRFLKGKMMTVRLQGFDLLNENTGIFRTVNETTITDSRTNRLARYFLLSVNMRIAKFAGGGNRGNWNRGGGTGGGRRPGQG